MWTAHSGLSPGQDLSPCRAVVGPAWLQGSSLHQSLWPGEAAPSLVQPEPRGRGGVSPAAVRGCSRGAVPGNRWNVAGGGSRRGLEQQQLPLEPTFLPHTKLKSRGEPSEGFLGKGFVHAEFAVGFVLFGKTK